MPFCSSPPTITISATMSARTPFVPAGARPASRAAHLQDQPNAQKPNSPFSLDLSNPLHSMPSSAAKPPIANPPSQPDKANSGNPSTSGSNRPLNTGSLLKRKHPASQGHGQNQNATRKASLAENTPQRPGTADPRSKAHQEQGRTPNRNQPLDIVAPVPRQAPHPSSLSLSNSLASDVFTTNNAQKMFRMPALPALSLPEVTSDNQPQTNTHISNSTLGFSFSNPHANLEPQRTQLPSPPMSIRTKNTHAFVAADTDIPLPPLHLNMSIPNQSGPQRVLLNPDGTRGPPIDPNPENDEPRLILNRTGSGLLKRSRAGPESDTDHQAASGEYKRYRNQDNVHSQQANSITSHPSSPRHHSARARNHSHTPEILTADDPRSSYQHQHPSTPPETEYLRQGSHHHHENADSGPRALDRLLGCDVDTFIDEHAEQYERAVARWKQATMAEWVAGADEQAARYAKILDFVKDHMTTKMKLFANFDAGVDGHNAVLNEREKTLEAVKGRLVQESANVLGTGCH